MWISSFVNQDTSGLDSILWLVLPIVCCALLMTTQRGGGSSGSRSEPREEVESWYTVQDIGSTYKSIQEKTAEWKKESEEVKDPPKGIGARLKGAIGGGGGAPQERFVVKEAVEPKLYRLDDKWGLSSSNSLRSKTEEPWLKRHMVLRSRLAWLSSKPNFH